MAESVGFSCYSHSNVSQPEVWGSNLSTYKEVEVRLMAFHEGHPRQIYGFVEFNSQMSRSIKPWKTT